jgi:hypothetical protein
MPCKQKFREIVIFFGPPGDQRTRRRAPTRESPASRIEKILEIFCKIGLTRAGKIEKRLAANFIRQQMKKFGLSVLVSFLAATCAFAAIPGTDNASNYGGNWINGSNGGTLGTFAPWDLTNNNNDGTTNFAGYFLGDSTLGTGDINTGGLAFAVYANPSTAFADANRAFGSALDVGQTFSLDIAVNFRNGNKGFSLFDGATEIFNLNIGSNDYTINGSSIGAPFSGTAIFSLSFTQTALNAGTYSVFYNGNSQTYNGNYTGLASGFKLYNSGTDNGDNANNLYFNNLSIVPEPSSFGLVAGPMLFGGLFLKRRRRV